MGELPHDVLNTAEEIVDRIAKRHVWKGDCVADIAQAILAERERCAQVASGAPAQTAGDRRRADAIAAAIRKGD